MTLKPVGIRVGPDAQQRTSSLLEAASSAAPEDGIDRLAPRGLQLVGES
jgi:hypothetical protein